MMEATQAEGHRPQGGSVAQNLDGPERRVLVASVSSRNEQLFRGQKSIELMMEEACTTSLRAPCLIEEEAVFARSVWLRLRLEAAGADWRIWGGCLGRTRPASAAEHRLDRLGTVRTHRSQKQIHTDAECSMQHGVHLRLRVLVLQSSSANQSYQGSTLLSRPGTRPPLPESRSSR
jgi:hypothetical protein